MYTVHIFLSDKLVSHGSSKKKKPIITIINNTVQAYTKLSMEVNIVGALKLTLYAKQILIHYSDTFVCQFD